MQTHVKKNSFAITALSLAALVSVAQGAPANKSNPPPAPSQNTDTSSDSADAPAPPASNNATEIDSSTSTALDYLFNKRPLRARR